MMKKMICGLMILGCGAVSNVLSCEVINMDVMKDIEKFSIDYEPITNVKGISDYESDQLTYSKVLLAVPNFIDSDKHQFNQLWLKQLSHLQKRGKELSSSDLRLWCSVTTEIMCNYDAYGFNTSYCKGKSKELKVILDFLQGTCFGDILFDSVAMFLED